MSSFAIFHKMQNIFGSNAATWQQNLAADLAHLELQFLFTFDIDEVPHGTALSLMIMQYRGRH
jgi:hypothetical protein